MVKIKTHSGKENYQCEACGFYYEQENLAQRCEGWCKKYKGCSLDITKHAVTLEEE